MFIFVLLMSLKIESYVLHKVKDMKKRARMLLQSKENIQKSKKMSPINNSPKTRLINSNLCNQWRSKQRINMKKRQDRIFHDRLYESHSRIDGSSRAPVCTDVPGDNLFLLIDSGPV